MGSGFSKKKKQMRAFQEQFARVQEDLANLKITGASGGGLVSVTLNGDHEMVGLTIKPDCVDPEDIEGLEDLIRAAHADALEKLKEESSQGLPDLSGLGALGL